MSRQTYSRVLTFRYWSVTNGAFVLVEGSRRTTLPNILVTVFLANPMPVSRLARAMRWQPQKRVEDADRWFQRVMQSAGEQDVPHSIDPLQSVDHLRRDTAESCDAGHSGRRLKFVSIPHRVAMEPPVTGEST